MTWDFPPKRADGGGTPAQFDSVAHEWSCAKRCAWLLGGLVDARPRGQTITAKPRTEELRTVEPAVPCADAVREVGCGYAFSMTMLSVVIWLAST